METCKVLKRLVFLQVLILLTACGGNRSIEAKFKGGAPEDVAQGPEAVKKALEEFSLSCDDGDDCPENVGALLTSDKAKQNAGVCTAFLVQKDQIITNSHCLKDLKTGDSCKGLATLYFPNGSEAKVGCEKILKRSDLEKDLDYALIQLSKPLKRKPMILDNKGLADESSHKMYSAHITSSLSAKIVAQSGCLAVQKSEVYPNFKNDVSAHVILANCHTEKGYSGSPIINSSGKVVAVNSDILEVDDSVFQIVTKQKYFEGQPVRKYLKAENLSCVALSLVNDEILKECVSELNLKERHGSDSSFLERKSARAKRLKEKNENYSEIHHTTEFEILEVTEEGILTLVPKCVKDPAIWESEYRNILTRLGLKSRKRDRMEIPVFEVESGYNKYYQMDYKVLEIDRFKAKYVYPIRKITESANRVKYKMRVETVEPNISLLRILFPPLWLFPIGERNKTEWTPVFTKDIPRC